MTKIIGIDLDNTIINYRASFQQNARKLGFISSETFRSKKIIRDHIRRLENGENNWQKLQAVVYGPRIGDAELMPGVTSFLSQCRVNQTRIYIVSHKTQFAGKSEDGPDLRRTALNWLRKQGFFHQDLTGLSEQQIFFEDTRALKVGRIKLLGCTHFIDDLEETFQEPDFPEDVVKLLFSPENHRSQISGVGVFNNWNEITDFFGMELHEK